jgi:hypothetical protein
VITAEELAGSFGFAEAFAALVTSASTACGGVISHDTLRYKGGIGDTSLLGRARGYGWCCSCCAKWTHLEAVNGRTVSRFHRRFETIAKPDFDRGGGSSRLQSPYGGVQGSGEGAVHDGEGWCMRLSRS